MAEREPFRLPPAEALHDLAVALTADSERARLSGEALNRLPRGNGAERLAEAERLMVAADTLAFLAGQHPKTLDGLRRGIDLRGASR